MSGSRPDDSNDTDPRFEAILAEYVRLVEAGALPDEKEFLAKYPEHREPLAEFLANYRTMNRRVEPVRNASHGKFPRPFGTYELLGVIDQGGMGVVYKARQTKPDRVLALKMIKAGQLATEEDLQRFKREAESAAGLDHPNIVPIHEVGEHEGQPYFTMRLVEGGSLADHIDFFRERPREAARLVATIGLALRHAHQRAILHRDLKPANILLDGDMQPLVTDFGLAIRVDRESRLTTAGSILGTLNYMSPEHARGEKLLTVRADVYSLGAILYEILTGRPPLQNEPPLEMLRKLEDEDPPHPQRLNPRVDIDLATICTKCLHKDPLKRYENCQGLIEDLENWLGGRPIQARPQGTLGRLWRWGRRHTAPVLVSATAALFLIFVAATVLRRAAEQAGQRREILRTNVHMARNVASVVLNRIRDWGSAVHDAAHRDRLKELLRDWNRLASQESNPAKLMGCKEAQELQTLCEELHRLKDPVLENWHILDASGMMVARTPRGPIIGSNFRERDYFQGTLRHAGQAGLVHVSSVFRSVADNRYKFDICVPVLDADARVLGVIGASVTTDSTMGMPHLHDERRKAVLVAPWDANRRPNDPARGGAPPEYLILLHPAYTRGQDAVEFNRAKLPVSWPRRCEKELSEEEVGRVPHERADYSDPFGKKNGAYQGRWLAGFAPVGNTGFIVIVQQRDE